MKEIVASVELQKIWHGVVVLLVLAFLFLGRSGFRPYKRRFRRSFRLLNFDRQQSGHLVDIGEQLKAVMGGSFKKQRVLSSSEFRIFAIVEEEVAALRSGCRVFAQTSLGEILRPADQDAFHSINSKRVDILVIDRGGWPILAVEYQGEGHFQGTAAGRDAVKKEALRKAGVGYMECVATDGPDQIRQRLREHLNHLFRSQFSELPSG